MAPAVGAPDWLSPAAYPGTSCPISGQVALRINRKGNPQSCMDDRSTEALHSPNPIRNTSMKHLKTGLAAVAALTLALPPISLPAAPTAEPGSPRELAVELGAPFHDHAVLQRGMTVPVWGWSKPGTQVTVEFSGQRSSATAGEDGSWKAELKDLKASFEPADLIVSEEGGQQETLTNILVGEVWMASGQSNMQWIAGKSKVSKLAAEFAAENEGGWFRSGSSRSTRSPPSYTRSGGRPAPGRVATITTTAPLPSPSPTGSTRRSRFPSASSTAPSARRRSRPGCRVRASQLRRG